MKEITNYEQAIQNIREDLKEYINKNNIKSLVVGVSGGIDSALCCALAKPICDELNIPLVGVSIPIESNKPDEIERAKNINCNFCTEFQEIDLTVFYKSSIPFLMNMGPEEENITSFDFKVRQGNIKARLRMIRLFDMAKKRGGMVLSTDNYTEYLLGYWTLAGDIGDYGMIQNLWKSEVYRMSRYIVVQHLNTLNDRKKKLVLESCIDAIPTDGLGITNSDLDQIKAETYYEVDHILKEFLNGNTKHKNHPVIKRHKMTYFKRNWPYSIPREKILKEKLKMV